MKVPMIRLGALALLLAVSVPSMATEPFQPLPDLESLPDLDSAPPRKLHADQSSWGQPVDANGNPNGSGNANPGGNANGSSWNNDNGGGDNNDNGSPGNVNGDSRSNQYSNDNNQNGSSNNNHSAGNNQNGTANDNGNGSAGNNNGNGGGRNGGSNSGADSSPNSGSNSNGSGLNSDAYPPLTKIDAAMQPNYTPPGMPQMPSRCAEDKACRPCFDDANANLDIRRRDLEKVHGIYIYTHRFAQDGKDLMAGVGGLAGGAPAVEAAVQSRAVDQSLDTFDDTVRAKNAELLGKLRNDLRELAACEARYYGNDEWYPRYGELYYQFMQARYAF